MTRRDRMRFTKNLLSSRLALLAIVFNVFFFVSIYKVNDKAYYTWLMGISIVYNLVFMLAAFLSSEGVKNYKPKFSILLIILAVFQIVRIFIYPMTMHAADDAGVRVMPVSQFVFVIICLVQSAGCLLASALVNLRRSRALAAYKASLAAEQA